MAVLATRVYIDNIAKQMGYRTGEYCGHYFIDKGEYRIYVLNAKEFSNRGYDRSFVKEHWFDWSIKKKNVETDSWEEIFRISVKYLTDTLRQYVPNDLKKLERRIQADIELTKSNYSKGLTGIAQKYNLDLSNPAIRYALQEAYNLGEKGEESESLKAIRAQFK